MSAFEDFPGLHEADLRAAKAADVLRSALDQVRPPRNGETWADLAVRLKGASVLAATAALELSTVAGWNEAAHAAADAGLLDGEEPDL